MPNCIANQLPISPGITESISAGFCKQCQKMHSLGEGNCRQYSIEFQESLANANRIDFLIPQDEPNPKCTLDYLFGKARGKMFGVMECMRPDGSVIFLHAFSGQYNGLLLVDGWAPPLFDVAQWEQTNFATEKTIKKLGRDIEQLALDSPTRKELRQKRRTLSRDLMTQLHNLYCVRNFRGKHSLLSQVFLPEGAGIPTGTGDCCAPKLLNQAILNNLLPLGMIEFYLGKENLSGTRQHGQIYPPCRDKCQPLLGYMLCGLDEMSTPQDT